MVLSRSYRNVVLTAGVLTAAWSWFSVPAHSEEFPLYNMDVYCRDLAGGNSDKNWTCGETEAAAYSKLQGMWETIPEKRKAECHNVAYDANTGAGSYARHLECIKKGR